MIGTQFHPEADPIGMSMYLRRDDRKKTVIAEHGEEKWKSMVDQLEKSAGPIHTSSRIF
jgi:hypothetical protein